MEDNAPLVYGPPYIYHYISLSFIKIAYDDIFNYSNMTIVSSKMLK